MQTKQILALYYWNETTGGLIYIGTFISKSDLYKKSQHKQIMLVHINACAVWESNPHLSV